MANLQPGHHTFGLRNSVDIYKIFDMVGNEYSDPLVLPFTRVYDTDNKMTKVRTSNFPVWAGDNQTNLNNFSIMAGVTATNFYTGVLVGLTGAAGDTEPIKAKGTAYSETVIGVVVGGTGPTLGNLARGPKNSSGFTGSDKRKQYIVVQYAGNCPVLLDESESVSVRGRFLELSTGVSGAAYTDVTVGLGQFGLCLTNSSASGMTAGHGPGLTGLLGNYVNGFIRPVETN